MADTAHRLPYWTLFATTIPNLGPPDLDGWATGDCPYCGDPGTFRVNLATGRWTCLPPVTPSADNGMAPHHRRVAR